MAKEATLTDVMSKDDVENIIVVEEYERLRRYCNGKWREQGENVLHRAYLRAFDAIIKGTYDPYFQQPFERKERERSTFYYYVTRILQSAYEDEMLASGWKKKTKKTELAFTASKQPDTRHSPIAVKTETGELPFVILPVMCVNEKVWERIEMPASAMRVDDNGNEHGIDEYADPNTLESQLFQDNDQESSYKYLNVEDVSQWFIAEVNAYFIYLLDICDFDKLFVLQAMCTKTMSLKDIATEKGLSHQNMTPTVRKISDELAKRMGIPRDRIKKALNIIKNETALNSQLIIRLGVDS